MVLMIAILFYRNKKWLTITTPGKSTCEKNKCCDSRCSYCGPVPVPIPHEVHYFPPCPKLTVDFDYVDTVDLQQFIDCGLLTMWPAVYETSDDMLKAGTELSRLLRVVEKDNSFWRQVAKHYCVQLKDLELALELDDKYEKATTQSLACSESFSDMPSLEDASDWSEEFRSEE
jgi:hypothetical protein